MFHKTIGILGGMGPVASADTYVELTRMCQRKWGAVQDRDYPRMFLYSLPLEDFDHTGFTSDLDQQSSIVTQLIDGLRTLEAAGSDLIIMDCNTIHHFFKTLQGQISVPIINLIAITTAYILERGYDTVGVLCSQTSKDIALYTRPLEEGGVRVLDIADEDQEGVNNAILAVMSGQIAFPHIAKIDALIDQLVARGAQCIILGCTEISNLAKQLNHHAVLVDSEALAIEQALKEAR